MCEEASELTPVEMYSTNRLWVRSRTFCYVYSIDSDWIGISDVSRGHPSKVSYDQYLGCFSTLILFFITPSSHLTVQKARDA